MRQAPILPLAALAVAGCVSEQNALEVQARADYQTAIEQCLSENFKTHLEKARCVNSALRRTLYIYSRNKDLFDEAMAKREVLAAQVDRHEVTVEEANLQLAQ